MRLEEWTPAYRSGYMKSRYYAQRAEYTALLGGVCVKCKATDGLIFDHIDPASKSFNIGAYWGRNKQFAVLRELKKCQLLCGPCNKTKTAEDLRTMGLKQGVTHGSVYMWMKIKCQCIVCSNAKRTWHDARNAKRRVGSGYGPRPVSRV